MPPLSQDENAFQGSLTRGSGASEYDAIDFIARQIVGRAATAALVQVKAVNSASLGAIGTVDVQPMVHQIDGYGNAVPHGVIHNLPYLRVQGGACAVIVDPQPGDIGIAWFASHDISTVKKTKAPALPGTRRRFDWADGLYGGGVLNGAPTQYIRLDPEAGITIQAAPGLPITLASDAQITVDAPMTHFSGDITTGPGSTFNGKSFDSHTHGGVQTGGGTSGPPS